MIVGVTIIVFLMIVVFSGVAMYNGIVSGKNSVKRAWANVITQERFKLKLIPKLTEFLQGYKDFEKNLLNEITKLRVATDELSSENIDTNTLVEVDKISKKLTAGLNVAVEAYPELKASELYGALMKELSEAESNIAASIRIFNQNVEFFNNSLQTFPSNLVNKLFNKEILMNVFTDTEANKGFDYKPNLN